MFLLEDFSLTNVPILMLHLKKMALNSKVDEANFNCQTQIDCNFLII